MTEVGQSLHAPHVRIVGLYVSWVIRDNFYRWDDAIISSNSNGYIFV